VLYITKSYLLFHPWMKFLNVYFLSHMIYIWLVMSNNSFVIASFPLIFFLRLTVESSVDVHDGDVEIGSFSLASRTKKHQLKIRYVSRDQRTSKHPFLFLFWVPLVSSKERGG
jgi:hypothetical protein